MAARYRRIIAGLALGCLSLLLTFHLGSLFAMDSGIVMRALKAAGFALVVPGLIAGILTGSVHAYRLTLVAAVNFVFWFGFAWLVATFIGKLVELRRAIGINRIPGDGSSSQGSR